MSPFLPLKSPCKHDWMLIISGHRRVILKNCKSKYCYSVAHTNIPLPPDCCSALLRSWSAISGLGIPILSVDLYRLTPVSTVQLVHKSCLGSKPAEHLNFSHWPPHWDAHVHVDMFVMLDFKWSVSKDFQFCLKWNTVFAMNYHTVVFIFSCTRHIFPLISRVFCFFSMFC